MSKRPLVRPLAWAPGDRGSGPVCLGFPGKTFSPLICFLTWGMGTKPVSPGTEEFAASVWGSKTPDAASLGRGATQTARWACRPGPLELGGLRLVKLGCRGGRQFSPLHWAGKLFLRILLCSRRFRACKRSSGCSEPQSHAAAGTPAPAAIGGRGSCPQWPELFGALEHLQLLFLWALL